MAKTEPMMSTDEIMEEHSSDNVFPDLPEDCRPIRREFSGEPCMIEMSSGYMVECWPGDTLWIVPDLSLGAGAEDTVIVAIDPVTIH